ncbi:hypothetical protein Mext_1606 [Methylorubrum extorquens PA1]|nr:hypothetical protein Mext_1606 [Methylorubrum extorquens PA1]
MTQACRVAGREQDRYDPFRRPPGAHPRRERSRPMRRRTRTLLGTFGILAFVIVYAPLAMALADSRISETHPAVQTVIYSILGIAWIFPLMPLIRWMDRPDN